MSYNRRQTDNKRKLKNYKKVSKNRSMKLNMKSKKKGIRNTQLIDEWSTDLDDS